MFSKQMYKASVSLINSADSEFVRSFYALNICTNVIWVIKKCKQFPS